MQASVILYSFVAALILGPIVYPNMARSQCIVQTTVEASNGDVDDGYGHAVAISGTVAVIGARNSDAACVADPECESGSAYIYQRIGDEWSEVQELQASDLQPGQRFGNAVAVENDWIVVGAFGDTDFCPTNPDCRSGAVYIFQFDGTTWIETQKLTASDAEVGLLFGSSVAIDNDAILIGAKGASGPSGSLYGAAYVFRFDGTAWQEEAKLSAENPTALSQFGCDVDIDGDALVVGSAGSGATVFEFDGTIWSASERLVAAGVGGVLQFGIAVAMSGPVVLVGTQSILGPTFGTAYVFRRNAGVWQEEKTLTGGVWFGSSVSLSGDVAAVGAYGEGELAALAGGVHIFEYDGSDWTEIRSFPGAEADAALGRVVAIDGNSVIATAPGSFFALPMVGSALLYDIGPLDCNNNSISDTCDIASGASTDFDLDGVPDECGQIFLRGDTDGNGVRGLSDPLLLLNALFLGGAPSPVTTPRTPTTMEA